MLPVHHRTLRDGERAAMYILIATAKLNGVDSQAWLAMCCAASPTIRLHGFTNFCRGIGKCPRRKPLQRERLRRPPMKWHDRP
jgi:hypothetical protein